VTGREGRGRVGGVLGTHAWQHVFAGGEGDEEGEGDEPDEEEEVGGYFGEGGEGRWGVGGKVVGEEKWRNQR